MLATLIHGTRDIRTAEVEDPAVLRPTDAVVRVVASCICGSDLWPYRGFQPTSHTHPIGHEFVGVVDEIGDEVRTLRVGQFVIAPFVVSDGTCVNCRNGFQTSCLNGAGWGADDKEGLPVNGGQSAFVRVPWADGTLVGTDELPPDELIPSLLTLSDVMSTGHHAAVSAGVGPGKTVAVVGDGAVGLCGVIAAKRLGAEQIIIMGRHADRIALARDFGATDVVSERGDEAIERVRELTGGFGVQSVLECVGHGASMQTAIGIARPGGAIGRVGVPQEETIPASLPAFFANVTIGGGPAPVRAYIEELLPDILEGRIEPGRVFDRTVGLDGVPDGYRAMADREAIKVMVRP